MGYGSSGLSFRTLRQANVARLPQFRNAQGEIAHSKPDGSDWSLGEWSNAVMGELAEAANIIKKIRRGDITLDDARASLADELADAVTYLDILAMNAGVDLAHAVADKFNRISRRVGSTVIINGDDWHYRPIEDVPAPLTETLDLMAALKASLAATTPKKVDS